MSAPAAPRTWQDDAALAWGLLSWAGEAQWFASKQEPPIETYLPPTADYPDTRGVRISPGRKRVMGGRCRSLDQLIGIIRNAEALGWDLYLQANPSREVPGHVKLAREDITHWRYITVDLDPGPDALDVPLKGWPGHCIFSGRGYQYWVPIASTPPLSDAWGSSYITASRVESIMRGYLSFVAKQCFDDLKGWIVDTSCSDLARVVRCPGSVNQKSGKRSQVLSKLDPPWPELQYLEHYALEVPEPPKPISPTESLNLLGVLPHLNGSSREFILNGATSPGRHRRLYSTTKNLYELGIPKGTALAWVENGCSLCIPSLSLIEACRVVGRVYGSAR